MSVLVWREHRYSPGIIEQYHSAAYGLHLALLGGVKEPTTPFATGAPSSLPPRDTTAGANDSPRDVRVEAIFQSNLFDERKKTGKAKAIHFHVEIAILLGAAVNALPGNHVLDPPAHRRQRGESSRSGGVNKTGVGERDT